MSGGQGGSVSVGLIISAPLQSLSCFWGSPLRQAQARRSPRECPRTHADGGLHPPTPRWRYPVGRVDRVYREDTVPIAFLGSLQRADGGLHPPTPAGDIRWAGGIGFIARIQSLSRFLGTLQRADGGLHPPTPAGDIRWAGGIGFIARIQSLSRFLGTLQRADGGLHPPTPRWRYPVGREDRVVETHSTVPIAFLGFANVLTGGCTPRPPAGDILWAGGIGVV